MVTGEHAAREVGLGARDADPLAALDDGQRADREPVLELRTGARIGRDDLVEELELGAGAHTITRAELDVDVVALHGDHGGLGGGEPRGQHDRGGREEEEIRAHGAS